MTDRIPATEVVETSCCIVGGGPAGMMLGLLLARQGVEVHILEKHADFLRDFRGDTIHPSTLEVLHEIGLLDEFLARPHQKLPHISAEVEGETVTIADFTHLPTVCKYIAFMPQWDFLDLIATAGGRLPTFHLRMHAEVTGLIFDGGRVAGVRAATAEGELELRAELVVGADGRGSVVREAAGLTVEELGTPMDVLWMSIPKATGDPLQSLGRIVAGRILILIDRGDYWQGGYVIPKGAFDAIRVAGLSAFREEIARVAPFLRPQLGSLENWDQVKLLSVKIDHLLKWSRPGLLCIGDSAHAMSPVAGVGINLAIQDAVATANIVGPPLRGHVLLDSHLEAVQKRRELPARVTQRMQVFLQGRIIRPVLTADTDAKLPAPFPLRLLQRLPMLRRIPARVVGIGFRPEHVEG